MPDLSSPLQLDFPKGRFVDFPKGRKKGFPPYHPAWLEGWSYRKSHVINPASGAGIDYQVKIVARYGTSIGTSILTFDKVSDATDMFYVYSNQVPNVRFGAGGLKFYSGGAWTNLLWYSKPPTVVYVGSGFQIFYKTGLVYYYGDNNNQVLVQVDKEPFILVRCVLGSVTVPLIDGYSYATDGSVVGSNVTLSSGQYVIFYSDSPPSLGTYYTTSIESGSGFLVHLYKTDGTTDMPFYLNFGSGEGKVVSSLQATYNRVQFERGEVKYDMDWLPPAFPVFGNGWSKTNGVTQRYVLIITSHVGTTGALPAYMDDPNSVRFQNTGLAKQVNYIESFDGYWGWSIKNDVYDTTLVTRYYLKMAVLLLQDGSVWKSRTYMKADLKSVVHNDDQAILTTGFGCWQPNGYFGETGSYFFNDGYYDYVSSWVSKTFSTTGYTYVTGARAHRTSMNHAGTTVYVYTKYLTRPQDVVTYKYARYYTHYAINTYFTLWADANLPSNSYMGVERWYAKADNYEVTPPSPTTQPETFYDQFFVDDEEEVYLNGHCRTDFGDVRFTDDDGVTLLDYWMEEKVDSNYAVFWVEVADDLSTNPATIYIYYGKNDATTTSSGANTFPVLFDDFEDGTVGQPPTGWTGDTGYYQVQNDRAWQGSKSLRALSPDVTWKMITKTFTAQSGSFAIVWRMQNDLVAATFSLSFRSGATQVTWVGFVISLTVNAIYYYDTAYRNLQSYSADTWYKIEQLMNTNTDMYDIYINGVLKKDDASFRNPVTSVDTVDISSYDDVYRWLDTLYIRKYVSPEPSHGAWGSEET